MSAGKLPEGWVNCELSALGHIVTGKTPSTKEPAYFGGEIPFIKPGDLEFNGYINKTTDTLTEKGLSFVPSLPANSIAVTCIGNLGKVGITTKRSASNQQINSLIPHDGLNNKFIYYQTLTLKQWLESQSSATTIAIVNKSKFSQAPIKLPALSEQKIIAEKLDTLLAQVDSTKARLEQIPQILKRFRQAVLASAVSGKLTLAWRENNEVSESAKELLIRWTNSREQKFTKTQKNLLASKKIKKIKTFPTPTPPDMVTGEELIIPINWEIVSVSQIADCLDSQRVPVKKEYRTTSEGIYPYFGANGEVDRVDNFIFDGDFVLVTEDETFYGRTKPIAYRFTGKCWVNNHVHILSAPTKAANDYLCYALMYYKIIPWLTGTTGRAKLTQGALNSLPIGLPPEEEINEIVRRVEQLFAYADTIEKQVNSALTRVNSLTQSILAKAFRGDLTAQWRAENPSLISGENSAAALLEKIKAERAASGGKKTSRKKS